MSRCLPLCLTALAAVGLSACSTTKVVQVQPIDGVISGQCHVDRVRGAVGLAASPGTVERVRVDSDSLGVQVVRGGTAMTGSETGGDRLTIQTGPYNNITALYCG